MQRYLKRNLLFLGIALLVISASLMGARLVLVHAYMQERVTLDGQTAPLARQAQVVQDTAGDQPLQLSISLQLRNRAAAESMLAAISDPHSPSYRHYLTPQQFKQWFAPTNSQVQQVVDYLRGQGMTVNSISANNLLINVSSTVAQAENSFQTQIKNYRWKNRTFHANASAPSLPRDVGQLVMAIGGLDDSVHYESAARYQANGVGAASEYQPTGLDPVALEKAYNLAPLHQAGIQGQGQKVALFALDGYQQNDVTTYFQSSNLPQPTIQQYLVDNDDGAAGTGALETTLDIEMLGAVAPQSTILVYEGPNTVQGINDTYAKIVNDNQAKVVSISWGLCEASTGNTQLQTLNQIFLQGALQGISFFAASGDSGAYDCRDDQLAVDYPASDPNVTAVGASSLSLYDDGSYASENVWENPNDTMHGPHGAGSGGGLSSTFAQPTWQVGLGVNNSYSNGKRQVPDVVAFGDPAEGFKVYCTVRNAGCPADGWTNVGGSSASAPFWAGSMLLWNQYLQANNKNVLGQINPQLYRLFNTTQPYAGFHDVTGGDNLYYPATAGYDLASGIGSPDVYNLARDFVAQGQSGQTPAPTPAPSATPTMAPTPTPTPVPVLIQNGGFEKGTANWRESSSGGFEIVDSTNPHKGSYSAFMCGYPSCDDRIWQTFTVPSSYNSLTLTYWRYVSTSGTSTDCVDKLLVRLQTATGTMIKDVQQICNTQATDNWVQQTVDLSTILANYKGVSVTLQFRGSNGTSQVTNFYVDDVKIAIA